MSLYLDPAGYFRSPLLDQVKWLRHGFGTIQASLPGEPLCLQQIHSDRVVDSAEWKPGCEGDALITSRAGEQLAVKTADCVPILLADTEQKVIAAVHAGWRGTLNRVAARTIERMRQERGSRPEAILAALGPAIGPCCFEVGSEVGREFATLFPERHDLDGRTRIDLSEANRRILMQCGVPGGNISNSAPCTMCAPAYFHSWRRDRKTGARMYSAIEIAG